MKFAFSRNKQTFFTFKTKIKIRIFYLRPKMQILYKVDNSITQFKSKFSF